MTNHYNKTKHLNQCFLAAVRFYFKIYDYFCFKLKKNKLWNIPMNK